MKEEEIRKLIKLVEESKIHELEVSRWGRGKIRITKSPAAPSPTPPIYTVPAPSSGSETEELQHPPESKEARLREITSPMPGTFYRAPAPDVEPFVEEGDRITVGQTVCIVEAMKVMNEINSDVEGIIAQITAENAQPVEYGQPLFLIKP